jgi:hypothetical protein
MMSRRQTPAEERAAQLVKDQAELQRFVDARQEAQEKADTDTVPEVELLDPAAEEIMTEAVAKIGTRPSLILTSSLMRG